jgi:CBS domain-containing protein
LQPYTIIEIFFSEEALWQREPLYSAIIRMVHDLKIPARCLVTKGIEGSYENGEIATSRIEVLSYNMPMRLTIVAPASESEKILAQAEKMVADGIITVQEVEVRSHKTRGYLIPRHMKVQDIMTRSPQKVTLETPLHEVARLLLSASFTGLPVVDAQNRPQGVISQGDLIYKASMPMRLGLLAQSDSAKVNAVLEGLASRQAREIMTQPAVVIEQDKNVTDAVDLMLARQVKRLPVIDVAGQLVGIISRLDIFHSILRECPDWHAFRKNEISVDNLRFVADIMRRDSITVFPDTPVEEVIRLIDCNDIQRLAVINQEGEFLGLISDRDLLAAFSEQHQGIWDYFASKIPFTERGRRHQELQKTLQAKTAGEVMKTDIITVREDAPINEAIRLMLERSIKRLPVLDAQGKFKGMVSREALLRIGFDSQFSGKLNH